MSDKQVEAEKESAEEIKRLEATDPPAQGNVHSEQHEEPAQPEVPPLPN